MALVRNLDNGEYADTGILTPYAVDAPAQTAGTDGNSLPYSIVWKNASGFTKLRWPFASAIVRNAVLTDISDGITAADPYIEVQTT